MDSVRDPSLALAAPSTTDSVTETDRDTRLARMVEEYFDFVWRLVRRLGVELTEADDATQEVFVIATRKLSDITQGSERTFLYGTAIRVAANARRSRRRRREVPSEADVIHAVGALPDELSDLGRARLLLDEILQRLAPPLRTVLVLAEIHQLEVAEIASLERIPVGTAASRLRRARAAFREHLDAVRARNPFGEER
jgi:RNA polymerase sigma-70 factor (ECF subfamily)